ncbi:MAG: hypothetical protein ACK5LY_05900 [Lachnospirales bacterium]
MIEKLKSRLLSFNITNYSNKEYMLTFALEKTINYVKNYCNLLELPMEIEPVVIDMAVGEVLKMMKTFDIDFELDFSPMEKSISEGDTTVTYAIGDGSKTKEEVFDETVNLLISSGKECLKFYRGLSW